MQTKQKHAHNPLAFLKRQTAQQPENSCGKFPFFEPLGSKTPTPLPSAG